MTASEFWNQEFGNRTTAKDFAGRRVDRDKHGQKNHPCGWNIDHIVPLSQDGGTDTNDNKQVCNIETNDEKGDKTTFVSSNGNQYQVKRISQAGRNEWANGYNYSKKTHCMVIVE